MKIYNSIRSKVKIAAAVAMTTAAIGVASMSVYAGQWVQFGDNWYYYQDDGTFATGEQWIDSYMYGFDETGRMRANETYNGYSYGADGKCYEFNDATTGEKTIYGENFYMPANWQPSEEEKAALRELFGRDF